MLLFVFWACLLSPMTASAVAVADLFEVRMTVLDESREVRRTALDDGLVEVLIRVSGDSELLQKIEQPPADDYVQRFEYSEHDAALSGGVAGEKLQRLWVRYNATRVLDFLRRQNIPIWGEHRSQTVIWLAVRDGGQRYILKETDKSPIKNSVDDAFSRRGIPAIWPKNDEADQQTIRFADVWAGFAEPLQKASKRYSAGSIIAANLDWTGTEWKGEWSLLMADELKKWSLSGADYASVIAKAADLIADTMGQKFAALETFDVSQQKKVMMEIDKVRSVEAFRAIENYLSSLSAVQSVQLSKVEPERVFFELALRTKVDDLINLIQSGSTLARLSDRMVTLSIDESITNAVAAVSTTDAGTDSESTAATNTGANAQPAAVLQQITYRFELR
ncbi:MAG: DUF2066 domain-containing protein [Gammaproteobacteria bacterium]|nr:DUF2066 domain-containing protein [Gammaproteobacteria bacterium]